MPFNRGAESSNTVPQRARTRMFCTTETSVQSLFPAHACSGWVRVQFGGVQKRDEVKGIKSTCFLAACTSRLCEHFQNTVHTLRSSIDSLHHMDVCVCVCVCVCGGGGGLGSCIGSNPAV